MFFGHLYVFGEKPIYFFCLFLYWVVCVFAMKLHELFIYLEIKSLLVTWFAGIFSHSVGRLFILFMVSFAVQKIFKFN